MIPQATTPGHRYPRNGSRSLTRVATRTAAYWSRTWEYRLTSYPDRHPAPRTAAPSRASILSRLETQRSRSMTRAATTTPEGAEASQCTPQYARDPSPMSPPLWDRVQQAAAMNVEPGTPPSEQEDQLAPVLNVEYQCSRCVQGMGSVMESE